MSARGNRYYAKLAGETQYVSEKLCLNGHMGMRATDSGRCLVCMANSAKLRYYADYEETKLKIKRNYKRNQTKILARRKQAYQANIEVERALAKVRSAEWRKNNPSHEGSRLAKAKYKKNNIAKTYAYGAKRRAALLHRVVNLSLCDRLELQCIYTYAKALNTVGLKYHVDHIIPLQGEAVSGIHTPSNLQVIPARDNLTKANRFAL